jgi:hypothetical protein
MPDLNTLQAELDGSSHVETRSIGMDGASIQRGASSCPASA